MFENWRFNVFTGTMHAIVITDEAHTVEYHADWNAYGIQLDEAPQLDNPSSVSIVEDVSGGDTFSEVPRTQAPEALQYRVDYDALTYYGTGRIEFNAADVGKTVLVSYKGTGWTLKNRYSADMTYITANLDVTEDASIDGDLTLTGDNTGKGNIDAAGSISAGGDLAVVGNADIDGNVTIGGPTGTGDLSVGGDVSVDGALEVAGGITGDVTGNADTVTNGVYTSGDQTINGIKTFGSTIIGSVDSIKETGSGAGTVRKKIIAIGDWDMNASAGASVSHGLTLAKIVSVHVFIIPDNSQRLYPLDYASDEIHSNGSWQIILDNVSLTRAVSGIFDSTDFDSTSFNRGWIVIEYVD